MPPTPLPHDAYAAFRSPAYRNYSLAYCISVIGRQVVSVAVGYEIFQRTHSAAVLGLAGLAGGLPVILLALPAGQVADRCNRKTVLLVSQGVTLLTSLLLAALAVTPREALQWAPLQHAGGLVQALAARFGEQSNTPIDPSIPLILLVLLISASARAFGWAARGAFVANLVPHETLSNAVTWNTSNFQISSMLGPALGGLILYRYGIAPAYLADALCGLVFLVAVAPIVHRQEGVVAGAHPLHDLFSGLRFVWNTKIILATITLDLFAMLLGGATALLPMFAEEILHVGPAGLGWLRAAPSAGALIMGFALAMLPLQRAGLAMLGSVAGFGVATIVFGLSRSFALSLFALALTGACDNVSVVVRHTLVQLLTPDAMRGRVSAVNNIFISSSNELGALESGLTAAYFGPVISVVGGGIGTILVVLAVACIWPEVRRIAALHESKPA